MNKDKLRVLVVSYLPWRNDVSVGNTLSNLFEGMQQKIEFANIYFKGERPSNSIATKYFYIPEAQLAKSILTRKTVGFEVKEVDNPSAAVIATQESAAYNKARQLRWESLLLAQDLISILGKWHSEKLDHFVMEFHPQLIFGPLGRVPAANILMVYLHNQYQLPVVSYAWDDHYSLKKKSLSPFFWIKTFVERRYIRKCANVSSFLYTITQEMQEEYSSYFGKECKLLCKAYDFSGVPALKHEVGSPAKIVYMGNIGSGRWKELAKVAQALHRINADGCKAKLYIYTMSPKSEKMIQKLNISGTSTLMDPVPTNQVLQTMNSADILVHVEPTAQKDRLFFRLSFSTKIVDYLYNARCIFALGGHTAAMSYLKRNDAAVVIEKDCDIEASLEKLLNSPDDILRYGKKAWECGVRNHQVQKIQRAIYSDFEQIIQTHEELV